MTPSRDELRKSLQGASAPAPRPEFVDRLAHRLEAMDQVTPARHVPVFRRPPAFGFLALAAAAALIAVLFAVLPDTGHDRRVDVTDSPVAGQPEQGEPGPTTPPEATTTTVSTGGSATTLPGATGPSTRATTVPTAAPGGASAPAVPQLPSGGPVTTRRPTDTSRPNGPAPTTTTTTAEPEVLTLACVAGQPEGSPGVQCSWSQSTSAAFYGYRLWRATGTEAKQSIYSVASRTATTYIDRPTTGVQHYMVEAYDSGGRVSGRSAVVEVTCC